MKGFPPSDPSNFRSAYAYKRQNWCRGPYQKNNANFSRKEARADKGCSRPQAPDQQINPTAKHTSSRSRKEKQTNDIV
jgi:hypothetical protein